MSTGSNVYPLLKRAIPIDDCLETIKVFNEFKEKVILSNKDNYVKVNQGGKDAIYLTKLAYRQVQLFYNLSDEIAKEEAFEIKNSEDKVTARGWKIWTRIFSTERMFGGRSVVGVGMCVSNEPHKVFNHGESDVYHTAATRSKNRAINDFVGGLAGVSAEEMYLAEYEAEQQAREKAKNMRT